MFWLSGQRLRVANLRFSKIMAMTPADLFRLLPALIKPDLYSLGLNTININKEGRSLRIEYHEQDVLEIGVIKIPRLQVDFRFSGYTTKEAASFIKQFDTVFRRGGG